MIALRIEEQKKFTSGLFIGELFDKFLLREADIVTFNRFTIDGRVLPGLLYRRGAGGRGDRGVFLLEDHKARMLFPDPGKASAGDLPHRSLPVGGGQEPGLYRPMAPGLLPEQAAAFIINIQYENQEMTCVTGTSMNIFTMDRTLEREWDESVKQFLKRSGIAFTC